MIEVDNGEELNNVLEKTEKVLVLFYASWCPYCTRFVPVFDKKIGKLQVESVIHVLIDDYDNPLWDTYDIEAVPTIIFFEKGKISKRLNGRFGVGLNERQFIGWLEELKVS
ncbi:MAG TPA: thioredoxin family protein [Candidatus Acidoferrum sp.]|nr:thioredoxin family protein [Candidatus Acidoferrum sp.]